MLKFDAEKHGTDDPRLRAQMLRDRNTYAGEISWDRLARRIRERQQRHRFYKAALVGAGILCILCLFVWWVVFVAVRP